MSQHLALPRDHSTIQQPLCLPSCNCPEEETGEIHLCVDYRKLNSITIWDAFPLPHIDEALQVVHNCNVFTSFNLAQGCLQLAMAEDDKIISRRLHLEQVLQAYMSLFACLSACLMLGQASAG